MEMQLIVATVAQKYRLHLAHGCLVAAKAGIVLRPKGRFLMALERRGERKWSACELQNCIEKRAVHKRSRYG